MKLRCFIEKSIKLGILCLVYCVLGCQKTIKPTPSVSPIKNTNNRNDTWNIVGIGGGGAMFYPTVSPLNPNFAFVSCDMGGSYVTHNGGESWRMFNLLSDTHFYIFDPLDSNTVYANSLALFKSTDKGKTWAILYPGSSEINGFVSKSDHAENVLITKDSTSRKVLALAIDPANSAQLYAAISINQKEAFYISTDGGNHFTKEQDLDLGVQNIYIDPASPKENRTIYIAGEKGIAQKINGIWRINKNPEGAEKMNHYAGGYDEKLKKYIIYAISGKSYFNTEGGQSGIFFTENGGITWENRQTGLVSRNIKGVEMPECRTIATSGQHPEIVYVSYNGLKIHADSVCSGVAKSADYGKTWQLVWQDFNKQIPSTNFSKDWLNDRFGPDWGENPFSIGVSPTLPDIAFASDFGRTIKTNNGGKTWEQTYSKNVNNTGWISRGLDVTTAYSIVFDPFDKNHVFIPTTDIGLMESTDGMASWNSATKNNGIPNDWINTTYWLTFDPSVKGKIWAVMSGNHDLPRPKMFRKSGTAHFKGGILTSENGGKTWTSVSTSIGEGAFTHILIDPLSKEHNRTLYACAFGKGVFKSIDNGKTWVQKNKGIEGNEPFAWQISRRESDGALFLIKCRRSEDGSIGNDKDGAIYISKDGAENWTKIPLPTNTNAPTSVAIGENNQLVLSAWGRKTQGQFTPDIGGGIYISNDDGKTWKQTLSQDQHIGAITYDARKNRYFACGFESSAYYSDDNAQTWKRIKDYNFKWGQRVEPDPFDAEKVFIITYGGGVWHGFIKNHEPMVEDISTPLNKK